LIKQDNYSAYRRILLEALKEENSQINELEFGKNLKEMQRLGYITQAPSQYGLVITITDKACEKLSRLDG
jgi:CTP-dependent riboflavin kinase